MYCLTISLQRYFGVHTTWRLQEYTTFLLFLYATLSSIPTTLYASTLKKQAFFCVFSLFQSAAHPISKERGLLGGFGQKISCTFRSFDALVNFCRIRGYISTVRKNGLNALDAIGWVFHGTPFVPTIPNSS